MVLYFLSISELVDSMTESRIVYHKFSHSWAALRCVLYRSLFSFCFFLVEESYFVLYTHDMNLLLSDTCGWRQGRIKLFGALRQRKLVRPLFQAVFLSEGWGYYPPD